MRVGLLAKKHKVTTQTIRNWIRSGKLDAIKTEGGHFRVANQERTTICYARVSSQKQESSIETQKEMLEEAFPEGEFMHDVGSGFNFKRRGLVQILERAMSGESIQLVATTSDRISRSGLSLICKIIELQGGSVVFLEENYAPESFDTQTLIAFLTSFRDSQSGKRSSKYHQKNKGLSSEREGNVRSNELVQACV